MGCDLGCALEREGAAFCPPEFPFEPEDFPDEPLEEPPAEPVAPDFFAGASSSRDIPCAAPAHAMINPRTPLVIVCFMRAIDSSFLPDPVDHPIRAERVAVPSQFRDASCHKRVVSRYARRMTHSRSRARTLFHARNTLVASALVPLMLTSVGCNALRGGGGSGGSSTIISDTTGSVYETNLRTRVYTFHDDNTADIYLTDLSDAQLTSFFQTNADWSQISGTIVHIHLFLDPRPGKTPIEPTAANASIRYGIISNGQVGIYDGAGFMLPGKKPGKGSMDGTFKAAPLRLSRATPGFADPLTPARLDLSFDSKLDDAAAPELQARLDAMAALAKPVN